MTLRMAMRLVRFRVTNFRSVTDSGWVDANDVTAFIGTNESGKTNLLVPLWKLNPAKEGAIEPTADYPRKEYNNFRQRDPKPVFIEAVFDAGEELAQKLAELSGAAVGAVREVTVSRDFDGHYAVDFPSAEPVRSLPASTVVGTVEAALKGIDTEAALKTEQDLKTNIVEALARARALLPENGSAVASDAAIAAAADALDALDVSDAPKTSTIVPRFVRVRDEFGRFRKEVSQPHPRDVDAATDLVVEHLPKFVYYSNYGNLDSEIYLPQVIQNLARTDLGPKEQAKARTLKVLFEFVNLKPQEIHQLGRDFKDPNNRAPTETEVASIREKKKERSILLQSASTMLTKSFREWWRQGGYRFRFEADGDHFRIWVADDKRPEEIELEGRSTGLQWFLSFYLVFLVESADAHEGALLLLDEPGLSLHPRAQKDLSAFFDGLAKTNQILYTTHSPFLVDADHLDRVRKVYVSEDGTTKASANLRSDDGDPAQRGAGYAVHAALGLSVAETLLLGCTPVVVEGPSDQHYLSAIKTMLISAGRLAPGRELVFPPSGGAKGVKAVASILSSRSDELPVALFDSDRIGRELADALKKSLYVGDEGARVLTVGEFTDVRDAEIEDLFPGELLARELDRIYRTPDMPFAEAYRPGAAIIPQIERWANEHRLGLVLGWKVELAKKVKAALLRQGAVAVRPEFLDRWTRLFAAFHKPSRSAD
jgi:hypothetical protein